MLSAHEKYLNTFTKQLAEITKARRSGDVLRSYNWNDLRPEERDKITKTNILRPFRITTKPLELVWACLDCRWRGIHKESKRDVSGSSPRNVCPKCSGDIECQGNKPNDKEIKKALSDYCELVNILRPYHTEAAEDSNTGKMIHRAVPLPPLKLTLDNVNSADYLTCQKTIPNTKVTKGMKLIGINFETKNPSLDGGQKFYKFV